MARVLYGLSLLQSAYLTSALEQLHVHADGSVILRTEEHEQEHQAAVLAEDTSLAEEESYLTEGAYVTDEGAILAESESSWGGMSKFFWGDGHKDVQGVVDPNKAKVLEEHFIDLGMHQCSCYPNCAKVDNTLVTLLIDIHKPHRSFKDYVKHFKKFMTTFNSTGIVAFVDPKVVDEVAEMHPQGKHAKTLCLIPLKIEETPEYVYKKDYEVAFRHMRRRNWFTLGIFNSLFHIHPEFFSAVYDMIQHAKAPLVARTAKGNPFQSEAFAWLDGGLHVPMDKWIPPQSKLKIKTCGDEKICYGFNKDLKKLPHRELEKYKKNKYAVALDGNNYGAGAIMTGNAKAWFNFQRHYSEMVREYLAEHVMDDDQGIVLHMYMKGNGNSPVEDSRCKGYERCPGWLLGHHNYASFEDHGKYLYQPE